MILSNNLNSFWASIIIEELVRCGVEMFYISPGSRSTPLTVAVSKNPKANSKIVYDERSSAFQALGYAKVSGKPAVLICTSGSAAANYYPAVIEAEMSDIPLIVLSADRPTELHFSGSNQTFDQNQLYGSHVKAFRDIEAPNINIPTDHILKLVDDIYSKAINEKGPVHINCKFREPLAPVQSEFDQNYKGSIESWESSNRVFTKVLKGKRSLDLSEILNDLKTKRSIILMGDCGTEKINIDDINIPVFTDIQFNGKVDEKVKIKNYDQLLLSNELSSEKAELVLIIGKHPVSKRTLKYFGNTDIITINSTDHKFDSELDVIRRIETDLHDTIDQLNKIRSTNTEWMERWNSKDRMVSDYLDSIVNDLKISELVLALKFNKEIKNSFVYVSSSMPIRFMDMYCNDHSNMIFSNRGVSGIDGVISSAIGASDALQNDVYLIIGDLAFIHDLNALTTLSRSKNNLKIILVNNRGGGIFRFLPISEHEEVFEENFVTPHEFNFKNMTLDLISWYNKVSESKDLDEKLQQLKDLGGNGLLEISLNNKQNFDIYKQVQLSIKELLQ